MLKLRNILKDDRFLPLALALMILIALVFSVYENNTRAETENIATTTANLISKSFPKTEVLARSAIVYDIDGQKVLYEKNSNVQLPLASVTKLVTAITASDYLKPDDSINITREALQTDGDSGLKEGEVWKFKDLLDFMLVSSSNDGATAIAIKTSSVSGEGFVSLMNKKIKSIGLNQTYFVNETGLDLNSFASGSYGSVMDLAKLLEYIWENNPDVLTATTKDNLFLKSYQFGHTTNNTNDVVNEIPGLIGSKTGFTDIAEGNLAIIFDRGVNQPVAVVVLSSSEDGRFTDTLKLVSATLSYFESEVF